MARSPGQHKSRCAEGRAGGRAGAAAGVANGEGVVSVLLGAIADDFTGATDLCNTLVRRGMRTVQLDRKSVV